MTQPRRPAPAPPRDEDLDFAALMQREGVTRAATPRGEPRPAAPRKPAAITPAPAATPTPPIAPPRQPARPDAAIDAAASVRAELATLRTTARKAEADLANTRKAEADLRAELAASRKAEADLRAELATSRKTEADLRAELATSRKTGADLRAELATSRKTEADLRAELTAVRAVPARTSLADALTDRGLEGAAEQSHALALLAAAPASASLLGLLEARDLPALAAWLTLRLALVCGDPACAPEHGAIAMHVEPPRCEVCGGSDIQRAAHGFTRACAAAGVVRVRFVGGSPNYRTKLAALFPAGGPLLVRTTAGNKHVRLSRSKSQQRGDDLVVVWGATELDHATSGAYRPEYGRVEVVAHRGIGRMLDLLAARLSRP